MTCSRKHYGKIDSSNEGNEDTYEEIAYEKDEDDEESCEQGAYESYEEADSGIDEDYEEKA